MTKRGIEKDLSISRWKAKYGSLIFTFSSLTNKAKFENFIDEYILENTTYILKKFKMNVKADYFLAISLYKKIEKRGFKIVNIDTQESISQYKIYEII